MNSSTSSDPIEVKLTPAYSEALRGIVTDMTVLLEIKTGEVNQTKRPPVDVAIVLDKSGSMSGSKLAQCKTAIMKVVDRLNSQDILHLVTYDNTAQVVLQGAVPDTLHKTLIIERVEGIKTGGSTNISAGLSTAAELLQGKNAAADAAAPREEEAKPASPPKHRSFLSSLLKAKSKDEKKDEAAKPTITATISTPPRLQRIFLFSDGVANVGISDDLGLFKLVERIHANGGPTVSSFGIGSDFRESTMRGISEHGCGHYIYMKEAGNIPTYVGKALDNLLGVIGIEAVLKLRGQNGCIVKKVFDHADLVKGAQLHDLRADNLRQIVAQMQITPSSATAAQVLSWELTYLTPATKEQRKMSGTLSLAFTDNEITAPANSVVLVAQRCQEVAEIDKKVLEFLGEKRMQEAILQKEIAIQMLKDVLPVDTTGFVQVILAKAERHLERLKSKRVNVSQMTKEIGYDSHLNRRLSVCAMSEMKIDLNSSAPADDDDNFTPLTPLTPLNYSPPRRDYSPVRRPTRKLS